MTPLDITLISVSGFFVYLFCAGIAYSFARKWVPAVYQDFERFLLTVFWPAYLLGFILYAVVMLGIAMPGWAATLVNRTKLPRATINKH